MKKNLLKRYDDKFKITGYILMRFISKLTIPDNMILLRIRDSLQ